MSKLNCSELETKKIEIENCRPEKRNKNTTGSKVSLQRTNTKQLKEKSPNEKSENKQSNGSKIFTIYEKRKMIEPLRTELLKRGWIEKLDEDAAALPKLVWLGRSNGVAIEGSPIVNRLKMEPLHNFCYKDVLIDYGRAATRNKKRELNLPRTFKLFSNERKEFMENYRSTAYSSFIRFLHAIEKLEAAIVVDDNKKCEIESDSSKDKAEQKNDGREFEKFKKIYQSVVKFNSKVNATGADRRKLLQDCNTIYRKCKKTWKDFDKDGFFNLWLLKPARRSLGIGIKLSDEDFDILSYAKDNYNMKYLVQKYFERPLLIYNTKFDLRQYFLVVHHTTGVCLWMYKMCYLKFSTKLYDPLNYKVSVHVTNTAVQSKYLIDKNRSRNIPQCNEWSSDRFLAYLEKENRLSLWDKKIYPAMKGSIIATVSAAVNSTTIQPNRFQLYGCDFVIDENYDPILLEINGIPILTSVICSMCLQDLVKVIVDKRENPKADTGHFEMIWEKSL